MYLDNFNNVFSSLFPPMPSVQAGKIAGSPAFILFIRTFLLFSASILKLYIFFDSILFQLLLFSVLRSFEYSTRSSTRYQWT